MENRESFVFYASFYEALQDLKDKERLQVYDAICDLALTGNDRKLSGLSKTIFTLIKPQVLANTQKFNNGKRGGRPKKITTGLDETETTGYDLKETTGYVSEETETKPNDNVNVNGNVNVNDNVNVNGETATKTSSQKKPTKAKITKHKHGEYSHVLLSDEEYEKLIEQYPNHEELIKTLDEAKEMKGYKYQSDYLAIKKWVVDAVNKNYPPNEEEQIF